MAAPLRRRRLTGSPHLRRLLAVAAVGGPALAALAGIAWTVASAVAPDAQGVAAHTRLFDAPGLGWSVWLSFWTGPATAAVALAVVALVFAGLGRSGALGRIVALMGPALAVPHAAAGLALAFLVAPSGFLLRLLSPWPSGFDRPPDWLVLNDPAGFSLFAGLVLKEIPFFFLMVVAVLPQTGAVAAQRVAAGLGYPPARAWLTATFPAVYARIRLPVYAVVAFSGSIVDMALILGPGTPPTLSARIVRWLNDPDIGQRAIGAAGALLQLVVTLASLLAWRLGEAAVARLGRAWLARGTRGGDETLLRGVAMVLAVLATGTLLIGMALLGLWSVATAWPFPDALPSGLTGDRWLGEAPRLTRLATDSLVIALASSALSLALAVALLETLRLRRRAPLAGFASLLLLPLLLPQVAFLAGLAVLMLALRLDGTLPAVALVHVIFVLPYLYLSLAGAWMQLDPRYERIAVSLGRPPAAVFWSVRVPLLAGPLAMAFAIGCAVSLGQYLPTLLIGGGRVATLTTEAVALASGGDRRLIGIYALAQTLLPAGVLALALALPRLAGRRRRGLLEGLPA